MYFYCIYSHLKPGLRKSPPHIPSMEKSLMSEYCLKTNNTYILSLFIWPHLIPLTLYYRSNLLFQEKFAFPNDPRNDAEALIKVLNNFLGKLFLFTDLSLWVQCSNHMFVFSSSV